MTPVVMRRSLIAAALPLALALAGATAAQAAPPLVEAADDGEEPRLAARLWIDPLGDHRFRVGVELVPDPGWHTYGEEPGDTGLPPEIRWHAEGDPGARFGELVFPVPERFFDASADLESWGYDRPVLLATTADTTRDAVPLRVEVDALVCANICLPARFELSGELREGAVDTAAAARFDAEAAGRVADGAAGALPSAGTWLAALAAGLLGGLILNLMPCVLPVLAMKLTALAGMAHSSLRERRLHALAYAGGISVTMLALAGAVLALRAAGHAVGWGFQLQEPLFLVALCCLLVVFALNLFGVFEIDVDTGRLAGLGADARGAARSFADGLLAVVLATPCSAPFLATAVGLAFASPAPVVVTVFLAIGLGLASPFLLAARLPGWTRYVPRSGRWMHDLRGVLGFSLLLVAVALLWVLGGVSGSNAISAALLLLLFVAGAAWALGSVQQRARRVPAAVGLGLLAAISAAGLVAWDWSPQDTDAVASRPALEGALPFDAAEVAAAVRAGEPAFVYYTADWCVTCKLNERIVFTHPDVAPELERLGYRVYRADWTRRDEPIRLALAALGRAGVPVYALYAPGEPESPRLLPELLTVGGFLQAAREEAGRPAL